MGMDLLSHTLTVKISECQNLIYIYIYYFQLKPAFTSFQVLLG